MKSLGIDIGTTTIGAAVLEDGCFITSETCKNNSFLAPTLPGERIQDAQLILDTALRTVDMLFERYPDIERIGVTGQMHGILYLDGEGNAVSPLYTWQDARGDAPCEKSSDMQSWTAYLCSETDLAAATGYLRFPYTERMPSFPRSRKGTRRPARMQRPRGKVACRAG